MAKKEFPQHLNIGLIDPDFPVIGQSTPRGFIWPILRELSQRGHKVTVFTWENSMGEAEIKNGEVTTLFLKHIYPNSLKEDFSRLLFDHFSKLHQENPFHIVHSLTRDAHYLAEHHSRNKKDPVAFTFDISATRLNDLFTYIGMSEERALSKIKNAVKITYTFLKNYLGKDRHLLKKADGLFVTSPQQKLILERYFLYPELKIHNVPYNVDLQDLTLRSKSESLRKSLQIPINSHVITVVSDMKETSDLVHILTAFQKVVLKKPNARLLLVGGGPFFKQVEYEMLNLALGSKVIMTGERPGYSITELIDLADIYLNLSSRSANQDSYTFEAMSQKKVVIGSEVSGLATVIEDSYDGFLLRPADRFSLTALVLDIFNHPKRYEPVGEAARHKILELFDSRKLTEQTLEAYQRILKSTRAYKN